MGDGVQNKFALILNGDTEPRHLENVDRAIAALRKEAPYHIAVSSTRAPKDKAINFQPADAAGLKNLIDGLASQMDDDDLLVLYTTGHGGEGKNGEGCVNMEKDCLSLSTLNQELKKIKYGRRIVVMDQCYGGRSLPLFENRKTSIVTQGSPGEQVSCQLFAPYFWSDQVPDKDQDGTISIQERYEFAIKMGKTPSLTQSLLYDPISLSGKESAHPFKTSDGLPVVVHNKIELDQQLKKLNPGQLALVMFGADWCRPCHAYQPYFENLAKQYDGRFLIIRAEGIKGSEGDWAQAYHFTQWPTVAFIDDRNRFTIVPDRMDPLKSLAMAVLMDPAEEFEASLRLSLDPDPETQNKAKETFDILIANYPDKVFANCLEILSKPESPFHDFVRENLTQINFENGQTLKSYVPDILLLFSHPSPKVRGAAADVIGHLNVFLAEAIDPLIKLFFDDDSDVSFKATNALGMVLQKADVTVVSRVVNQLVQFLNSPNPKIRYHAVITFWHLPHQGIPFLPLFFQKLEDPDPLVRKAAIVLLADFREGKLIDPKETLIVPKLIKMLKDPDSEVGEMAAINLIRLGNPPRQDHDEVPQNKTESPTVSDLLILQEFPKLLRFFPEAPYRHEGFLLNLLGKDVGLKELFYYQTEKFRDQKKILKKLAKDLVELLKDPDDRLKIRALWFLSIICTAAYDDPPREMTYALPILEKLAAGPSSSVQFYSKDLLMELGLKSVTGVGKKKFNHWSFGGGFLFQEKREENNEGFDLWGEYGLSPKWKLRAHSKEFYFPELRSDLTIEMLARLGDISKPLAFTVPLLESGVFHYWEKNISGLTINPVGFGLRWEATKNLAVAAGVKFSLKIPFHGTVDLGAEENISLSWTP